MVKKAEADNKAKGEKAKAETKAKEASDDKEKANVEAKTADAVKDNNNKKASSDAAAKDDNKKASDASGPNAAIHEKLDSILETTNESSKTANKA